MLCINIAKDALMGSSKFSKLFWLSFIIFVKGKYFSDELSHLIIFVILVGVFICIGEK